MHDSWQVPSLNWLVRLAVCVLERADHGIHVDYNDQEEVTKVEVCTSECTAY
jgi:hypothetical protein